MRSCIIWTVSKDDLQRYLNESSTLKEVIIDKLGMKMKVPQGMHYKRLKKRIEEDRLSMVRHLHNSAFFKKLVARKNGKSNAVPNETCFVENSKLDRCSIKNKIVKQNLLPYECRLCQNSGQWREECLSLELDHINQINDDNRLENLRFLCPNCHSQITNSYRASRKGPKKKSVCKCGNLKHCRSYNCQQCRIAANRILPQARKFNPSKEELQTVLLKHKGNICAVSRSYLVSDNAIRRRCRLLNISWK